MSSNNFRYCFLQTSDSVVIPISMLFHKQVTFRSILGKYFGKHNLLGDYFNAYTRQFFLVILYSVQYV
jgi:hypothetical protein